MWEISPTPYAHLEKKYDVAIVLGGMSGFDGNYNMLEFNESSDRILHAIKLYKKGIVKKILISGGTGTMTGLDIRESPNLKKYLIEIGINENDIIIEKESRNTIENAKYSAFILNRDFKNGNFLLVTSALHMRRALLCFEKQRIKVSSFSCDFSMSERKFYFDHLFLPEAEILARWENLIHEWIGYIVYRIKF
ncbi:MAG: YdcF family protein [Flavobacteriales bacterium]|nr:YdcF family protein [Flavobacteriales bacterium]